MSFPDASRGPLLHVFVYGTLRAGQEAHERYCDGAVGIVPARVAGRVDVHPAGYPRLVVPANGVLARGTGNPRTDLATQRSWAEHVPDPAGTEVEGETIFFDDPETRLPVLDDYEEFVPGGGGEYDRVLLPVRLEDGRCVAAWGYVRPVSSRGELAPD